jgi:hypothetical protein
MADRRKGIKAWLVQWEWATEAARVNKPLIAVVPSRTGHRRVARFVELVYAGASYDPAELLDYTVNPRVNPYHAQYPRRLPAPDGRGNVPWHVAVVCGHNPYVTARLVQNLRAIEDEHGGSVLAWNEIEPPEWAQRLSAEVR